MNGVIEKRTGLALSIGLSAAAALWSLPAQAADLGGDCCGDLEERVAELEATTARKGNRKLSLEIYGQVNQGVLWWDDGAESNAYVVTNDNSRSRFGLKGKAKIDKEWEGGYRIEIGSRTANSKRFTQLNDEGNDNPFDVGFDIRDSYWYLKNKRFGTASLGLQASATDQITEINQTQTALFSKYSDLEDTGLGLLLRSSVNGGLTTSTITPLGSATSAPGQAGLTWRRLIGDGGDQPGEGERRYDLVKYESVQFQGFSASASWGEDDLWDVAVRYEGAFNGIKISAGLGYGEQRDGYYLDVNTVCAGRQDAAPGTPSVNQSCDQFGGSFSVLHESSGLFVNAAAGTKHDNLIAQQVRFAGTGVDDDQEFWAIQAGVERKFNEYGKTTIYGEYYDYDGGGNSRRTVTNTDALSPGVGNGNSYAVWGTGVQSIGGGIAQGFDKAALVLYLSYRHVEGDLSLSQLNGGGVATGPATDSPLEDLDLVFGGGVIKF